MKKYTSFIVPIISFLAICFLLFIFTFYVDGEMGIILIFFTFFAPIVSILLTLIGRNKIEISIENEIYAKKGETVNVKIKLSKKTLMPIGFVEIHTDVSENFHQQHSVYRTAASFEKKSEIIHSLTALYGGYGFFGIRQVYVCDYLGFLKFKIKTEIPAISNIGVIPEIPQISASTELFRTINNVVVTSDDEEENNSALAFSANTFPGYEHREYIEGDSLKRINWKISSKRNKLMVRLDEAISSVQPVVVFDLYREKNNNPKGAVMREEHLYESVFGLLTLFIKHGIGCKFIHCDASGKICESIVENEDTLNQILFALLTVPVLTDNPIDYNKIDIGGACAVIAAVPFISTNYVSALDCIRNKNNSCAIVADTINTVSVPSYDIWFMDENNDFKLVK